MTALDIFERPGKWRAVAVWMACLLACAPGMFLIGAVIAEHRPESEWLGGGFGTALVRSLEVGAVVAILALSVGLPAGTLAALYQFPARRTLLVLIALPLLLPSFLWAIGASMLRSTLRFSAGGVLLGFTGTVLAFSATAVSLVILVTLAGVRIVTRRQADAARMAGGEASLIRTTMRAALPSAALAALLSGVLTLADPGPGQILGHAGAGFEILTSFSAQYDFALAARQCLALSFTALLVTSVGVGVLAMRRGGLRAAFAPVLAREPEPVVPISHPRLSWFSSLILALIAVVTLLLPLAGFLPAALRDPRLMDAWNTVFRTGADTVFYSLGAATIAVMLALTIVVSAGRNPRLRIALLLAMAALFALPPALGALGWVQAASSAPAFADVVLRSRGAVALQLAFHALPIAVAITLRSVATVPPSWAEVASIHGVPGLTFARRIVLPALAPALRQAALLVALLALSDIGTALLLTPPGSASLPLAIFTIMANAPEGLVATLCLGYIALMALIFAAGWTLLLQGRSA